MPKKKKKKLRRFYDYSLLFTIVFLTIFGLVMIYSSSSYMAQINYKGNAGYFMTRQAGIALAGFFLMIMISRMDYHWYARFSNLAILVSWGLMIAVSLFGREVNGKRRWLGVGSASFQPTELVKITVIVAMAALITRIGRDVDRMAGVARAVLITVPLAVIVAANNLSSGIIIVGIGFVMMFVASKKQAPYILCVVAAAVVLIFAGPIGHALTAIKILQPYQLTRINVWLNPEAYPTTGGYQVLQGLYAIGSGGLFGKGLGESIQMIYRFLLIAGNAPDLFGAMLVVGVMAHIAIQVILNIAVVTNTIPNTGITLPFISYGGTSVLFLMIEMGMVLSVSNQIKLQK